MSAACSSETPSRCDGLSSGSGTSDSDSQSCSRNSRRSMSEEQIRKTPFKKRPLNPNLYCLEEDLKAIKKVAKSNTESESSTKKTKRTQAVKAMHGVMHKKSGVKEIANAPKSLDDDDSELISDSAKSGKTLPKQSANSSAKKQGISIYWKIPLHIFMYACEPDNAHTRNIKQELKDYLLARNLQSEDYGLRERVIKPPTTLDIPDTLHMIESIYKTGHPALFKLFTETNNLSAVLARIVGRTKLTGRELIKQMLMIFKRRNLLDPNDVYLTFLDNELAKVFRGVRKIHIFTTLYSLKHHLS